jgi:hypothetical protein
MSTSRVIRPLCESWLRDLPLYRLLSVVGVSAWARQLGRQTKVPRFASRVGYVLAILSALAIVFGIVSGFVVARSGLTLYGPGEKARALAEGISEAMNCSALGFLFSVVAALWLLLCSWRWRNA